MPCVLLHCYSAALDAPPVLRPQPVNLYPPGFEVQISKPSISDVEACPISCQVPRRLHVFCAPAVWVAYSSSITFLPDLADAIFITLSLSMYSCSDRSPCELPMTLPEFLGSLGAKPQLVLHHRMMHRWQVSCLLVITAWYTTPKLELALTIMLLTVTSQPTSTHHEPRDTSNALNIVNHSSSKRVTTIDPHKQPGR